MSLVSSPLHLVKSIVSFSSTAFAFSTNAVIYFPEYFVTAHAAFILSSEELPMNWYMTGMCHVCSVRNVKLVSEFEEDCHILKNSKARNQEGCFLLLGTARNPHTKWQVPQLWQKTWKLFWIYYKLWVPVRFCTDTQKFIHMPLSFPMWKIGDSILEHKACIDQAS